MWGKPDALDSLAQVLVGLAGLVALGNGLAMIVNPFGWYEWLGTVKATGPANGHFIRDIGLAYLTSAALLGYAAGNLPMRWAAALAGAGWLAAHGILHIWEVLNGICSQTIFWQDAPGTLGPPLIALAGIGIQAGRTRILPWPMPSRTFLSVYQKLTRNLSPHLHDISNAPGRLAEKLAHFMPLNTHGHAAAPGHLALARMGAVLANDCGPCVEITAYAALAAGLSRDLVNAALEGSLDPGDEKLVLDFAGAVATARPEVGPIGDEVERRFGRAVRTELTIAAATAAFHPALKRGLGFAQGCSAHPVRL